MNRAPDRTSHREDVITMALASWTTIGLFVDAYKHSTDPGLETFWTPWHALFYSGFLATSAWILWLAWRRRRRSQSLLDAAPRAHRSAIYGIVVFGVGGIGDAVWHTIFGVEESLDALLSPTHLVISVGALAMASAPLRAAWSDRGHDDAASFRRFSPVLASLTIVVTTVAFFLEYVWTPVEGDLARIVYEPGGFGEITAALGVAGVLVSTAVLMAPVLLASRRWELPFGSVTLLFGVLNGLIGVGFDEELTALPAVIAAGLTADALIRSRSSRYLLATVPPLVLWAGYFALVGRVSPGLGWPPEIWGGAIFFSVLVGTAVEAALRLVVRLDAVESSTTAEGRP